jgi:hypothetical protein
VEREKVQTEEMGRLNQLAFRPEALNLVALLSDVPSRYSELPAQILNFTLQRKGGEGKGER